MNKGKVIIGIIVVMLIIAVVVGALAAFTNVFKKSGTTDKDKLEYKALKETDKVKTLYFNQDYMITDLDYINTMLFSTQKTIGSASDSFSFYILYAFDVPTGGNTDHMYIGMRDSGVYGMYVIEILYVDYGNLVKFKEPLYVAEGAEGYSEDLGYEIKTSGWQKKALELAQFAGNRGLEFGLASDKWIYTQSYSGKFISANGAFIKEV